jgi:hypothetical protein
MKRLLIALVALGCLASPGAAMAGDSPAGFWYGTDSWPMPVTGSGPYSEPTTGGSYGGYMGMIGNWAVWWGCKNTHADFIAWSQTNATEANADLQTYGRGAGTGIYWFMGGPGVDPGYNGTATEAYDWGEGQAARTLQDTTGKDIPYTTIWMDVEEPGISPAPDNGWNDVYTSTCSGQVKQAGIPAALDRATFNGYWDYIEAHSKYTPGVYSSPAVWSDIFGTGSAASIPHTQEWTYEPETTNLSDAPSGFCLGRSAGCATWFGGVSPIQKTMWQWSGGGGVSNGIGDFDQIKAGS